MKTRTPFPELLHKMDAYWHASMGDPVYEQRVFQRVHADERSMSQPECCTNRE